MTRPNPVQYQSEDCDSDTDRDYKAKTRGQQEYKTHPSSCQKARYMLS